ncbi:MAG: CRTAC1 family protein, partial [Verrucomicrobiota bacterium]
PFQLSQFGPAQAWGDMDRDGLEDFWMGSGAGHTGIFYYNKTKAGANPKFDAWMQPILRTHTAREDMGAVFLDVDADGDLDLYVASGSVESPAGSADYKDRLYLNKGWGQFTDGSNLLPDIRENSSAVAAADFDRDGDLDIFVGTRSVVGQYPKPADSHLLINDGTGKFRDGTREVASGLIGTGLVTGALWSDVDNDGWVDLVVSHDWGPIKVFRNREGHLESPTPNGIQDVLGWWTGVAAADLDNDGDMDLVASNLGTNSQYQASAQSPELIFYGDFDGSGKAHIVEANFENGVCYPRRGLSCSSHAMPIVKKKLQTYHNFASASLSQIYPIDRLQQSTLMKANELRSGAFLNDGSGNFEFQPLPHITQVAPGFGVVLEDFDLDGYTDCYIAQNHLTPQEETGPMRGGLSQLLRRNPQSESADDLFIPVSPLESGLVVNGDAKSVTTMDLNRDRRLDIVVGINNSTAKVFINRAANSKSAVPVRLKGLKGNADAAGSRIEVKIPGMPVQVAEVALGSGFLSNSSSRFLFAKPEDYKGAVDFVVRWPDGTSEEHQIDATGELIVIKQPEPVVEEEEETPEA